MENYLGEIRLFAGNFGPVGWAICDGRLLRIDENDALFSLIGTTYGGDGAATFALPDLRGRVPVHMGQGPGLSTRVVGEMAGTEQVTLTTTQIPAHSHALLASSASGSDPNPGGNVLGQNTSVSLYLDDTPSVNLNAAMVTAVGGSQPHENMQPFLCLNFIIALYGIYPTQS